MRNQKINFPSGEALCVFPAERADLAEAISELRLEQHRPVIVLIGGEINSQHAKATRFAIQKITSLAEELSASVICGGTDMGVMAEIGQERAKNNYTFPLVGITLEDLVTWPDGPKSTNFLWWGKKRWQLAPHYSHFILVPGSKFGDESAWIIDAATLLSKGHKAVTILINGGEVSRKDIALSLEHERAVIVINRTGRLADELSRDLSKNNLINIADAHREKRITQLVKEALTVYEVMMPAKVSSNKVAV